MKETTLEARPTQCQTILRLLSSRQWVPFEQIMSGVIDGVPFKITQQNARKNELQKQGHRIITRLRRRADGTYVASDWRLADVDDEAVRQLARMVAIVANDKDTMRHTLRVIVDDVPTIVERLTAEQARGLVQIHGGHRGAATHLWRQYVDPYNGEGVTLVRCRTRALDGMARTTTSADGCMWCTHITRCVDFLGGDE